jgi:hypothetical protein
MLGGYSKLAYSDHTKILLKFLGNWWLLYLTLIKKNKKLSFGFSNVILLYSDQQNISSTHVAIFRVVNARTQIYF